MEIKVIEHAKKKMVFEILGADHTFSNGLKEELNKDDNVKIATYTIEHPLIRVPKFIVESKGEKDVISVLKAAAKKLGKTNAEFLAGFKKAK